MKIPSTFVLGLLFAGFLITSVKATTGLVLYQDGANFGFNSNTAATPVGGNSGTTLGAQRRIAFEYALNRWANIINGTQTIRVKVRAVDSGRNGTLASAYPLKWAGNWTTGTPPAYSNTLYPSALADQLSGTDFDSVNHLTYDIQVSENIGYDTVGPTDTRVWYYGLDGNAPGQNIDFVGVVFHEIGHGLGFSAGIASDGTYFALEQPNGSGAAFPTIFSQFITNSAGNAFNSMTPAAKAAAVVSNDLFVGGPTLKKNTLDGLPAKLFAPNPWQQGSSMSHFDEDTYSTTGNLDEQMTPEKTFSTQVFGPLALDMLTDMGYQWLDDLPPTLAIQVPMAGQALRSSPPPVFSGTAADTSTNGTSSAVGVLRVKAALYDKVQGKFYNWGAGAFDTGTWNYDFHTKPTELNNLPIATGTRNWKITLPSGLPDGQYQVFITAVDQLNQGTEFISNESVSSAQRGASRSHGAAHSSGVLIQDFSIDQTGPEIHFTPHADSETVFDLREFKVLAYDAVSGTLRISRPGNGTTLYWTGSAWVSSMTTIPLAPELAGRWQSSMPLPGRLDWPVGSTLTIVANALDAASNLSTATLHLNRTASDTTNPEVSVDSPINGTVFTTPFLPTISGMANDLESGIDSVSLTMTHFLSGGGLEFWNGAAWSGSPTNLPVLYDYGTGQWTAPAFWALPGGSSLPNGNYALQITATNRETPARTTGLGIVFTIDYHPVYTWTGSFDNNWNDSRNWLIEGSASYSIPGPDAVVIINGGSPTIPAGAQLEVHKLVMNGGVFTQGELTALKKFEWTGGQIWGTVNVASQAVLEISGANPKYLIAYGLYGYGNPHAPGILNNAGTGTWTGTGDIQMQWRTGNAASLNNSGTFHIQTDADMTNYNGGAFVNTGSVDKAASSDVTRLDLVVTNGGTMRADTGRLVFAGGGGVSTGEYQLTSVNCLEWAGGTHTLATGARFTGAGRALISAGTVQGATDTPAGPALVDFAPDAELELAAGGNLEKLLRFTGSGLWRWTGGIVWGILDVTSDMQMAVDGSEPKYLIAYNFYGYGQTDGRGIINLEGTGTWGGTGELQQQWGAKIVNTGSLTVASDADMTNYNGGSFVNQGLLRKAGSGGDTVFSGVVFSSPGGTLDVQTGVVSLASHGSHSFDTGTQLTGAGRTRIDSATLTASGAIGGTGHIELAPSSALGGTHEFTGATFHWTGGSIIGTTTVGPAAALDISGPEVKVLQGYNLYGYGNPALPGILVNKGTGVWTGAGEVNIQWAQNSGVIEGGTFRNEGTMSIQTDADMTVYNGGRFVNTGTLTKELSGDVTRFDVSCSNNGTVYATSGKLQINGGGASSGQFDMQVANSLDFTGGTSVLAHGASFTSPGRARITGGTVAFANTIPNDVTLGAGSGIELATGGRLARDGTFLGLGTFQWTGGVIAGTTNFNGATVFDVSGPDGKVLDAYGIYGYGQADGRGTVNLNSTAVWRGAGSIQCQWGAVLRNNGTLDLQSDAELNEYAGGTFHNAGTLRKSGGAGMSRIAIVALNNTGALDIQTGVLSLLGNHTLNPGTSIAGAGRLRSDGGSVTVTGTVTGAGHFEHSVGTLAGTHTFTAATLHWTGGEIVGVTTVGPAAFLDISGPAVKVIQGYNLYGYGNPAAPGILNNKGTATWTGTGEIQTQWASGVGARLNNSGTFRVQTTALFSAHVGGSFVNSGQLVVGASPGIFNIGAGFIQSPSGVLNVEIAGLMAATPEFDQIKCLGACTLGGTLNVTLLNGFNPTLGDNLPVMTYASRTGEFAIFNSPGAYFSRNYNAGDLTLTATNAPSTLAEWMAAYFAPGSPESASDADPDGDGLSNFAEFVFNTNPLSPSPVPQDAGVETIDGQQWLTLGYRRWANPEADGVIYTPQVGGGLGDWGTIGIIDEVDPNAPVIPGSTACRCRVLIGGPAKFLRVKVTKG